MNNISLATTMKFAHITEKIVMWQLSRQSLSIHFLSLKKLIFLNSQVFPETTMIISCTCNYNKSCLQNNQNLGCGN